ncbi:MAG: DNA polymerase III subunit beta [Hyphomicrobiaceae bacterium]|nr:DNA polymerase III subunit beta [Hyphomicrobiaceae bacterium]
MKFVIERGELLKALGHVTSVVERRTTIPILSNILMRAVSGSLQFNATDLEREVSEKCEVDLHSEGALTVSAHLLHDIARKLPDVSRVELKGDIENGRLLISSAQSRFALQTLPAEDFPDLTAGEMSHEFMLQAHKLKRLIEKTRFAISTEETRYYLNGIFLHVAHAPDETSTLRAVATDGHRLAQSEISLPNGASGMPGVIIPRKTVSELHRLLEDGEREVIIQVSSNKVRFEIGHILLTSKLIDGQFPDYARVIPQNNSKKMQVSNTGFAKAVDRVSTIASERGRAVKLNITSNRLMLSVNNPEGGSATEELDINYNADDLEIGFSARYLLDIMGQLESEKITFLLADAGSPTLIRDTEDSSVLYVLMPIRV